MEAYGQSYRYRQEKGRSNMSFTEGKLELCENFSGLAQIDGKTVFVVMPNNCETVNDIKTRKDNGKRLLQCWNGYDELYRACEKAMSMLNHVGHPKPICVDGGFPIENGADQCQWCDEYNQIKAALTSAKRKK